MIVPEWSFAYVTTLEERDRGLVGRCATQMTGEIPGLLGREPTLSVEKNANTTLLVLRCDPRDRERLWHFGERARSKAGGRVSRLELANAPPLAAGDELELEYTQACDSSVAVKRAGEVVFTTDDTAHWRHVYWSWWTNRVNRITDPP